MSNRSDLSSERVSAKAAARRLGVSVWTVYRQIHAGELAAIRVGHRYQVLVSAISAALEPTGMSS